MNRKLKLAVLALLGFSTACSTVRQSSSGRSEKDSVQRVIVMYGVRSPEMGDAVRPEREEPLEEPLGEIAVPLEEEAPEAPEKTSR